MSRGVWAVLLCAALALAACGSDTSATGGTDETQPHHPAVARVPGGPPVPIPPGPPPKRLVVNEVKRGHGPAARHGDELTVRFNAVRYVDGALFESSWEPGARPFTFRLQHSDVSPGWVRGLDGMRVGGRRRLIVPPVLISRYGVPPGTGPEQTLVYVIDLVDLSPRGGRASVATGEPTLEAPTTPPPKHLVVRDLIRGSGAKAQPGDELTVEYIGIHYDGSPFTNSWQRAKPFRFRLGAKEGLINPGWERGLPGMRVGGRRKLVIPPRLTTPWGVPPGTGPEATLVYVVDLKAVRR